MTTIEGKKLRNELTLRNWRDVMLRRLPPAPVRLLGHAVDRAPDAQRNQQPGYGAAGHGRETLSSRYCGTREISSSAASASSRRAPSAGQQPVGVIYLAIAFSGEVGGPTRSVTAHAACGRQTQTPSLKPDIHAERDEPSAFSESHERSSTAQVVSIEVPNTCVHWCGFWGMLVLNDCTADITPLGACDLPAERYWHPALPCSQSIDAVQYGFL